MEPVQNVPQPHRDKLGLLKELVHTSVVSQRILKTASNLAEGFNVGAVNVESHLAECWQDLAGNQHLDYACNAKHSAWLPSATEEMHSLA